MKKIFFISSFVIVAFLFSCKTETKSTDGENESKKNIDVQLVSDDAFKDTLNGKVISVFYLRNKGIEAAITNYGARLVNILVADRDSNIVDVLRGAGDYKNMSNKTNYGAIIGRYGNRIANGKFTLDGVEYTLPQNNGVNTLHGGPEGFHVQVWDPVQVNDSTLQLSYLSKDGEMGFPGNLNVKVVYTLTADKGVKIDYEATTDKTTVCNLTNHAYFNLNGSGPIKNHTIQINADEYIPVDSTSIPIGKKESVKNTPFDFTQPTIIDAKLNENNQQLIYGKGFDHTYVLNGSGLRKVAEAKGDKSGITMEVYTTEPGMQFYTGNFMTGTKKLKYGTTDEHRTALCLETQHYPNSPNVPSFPTTTLKPGQVYKTTTIYKFRNVV